MIKTRNLNRLAKLNEEKLQLEKKRPKREVTTDIEEEPVPIKIINPEANQIQILTPQNKILDLESDPKDHVNQYEEQILAHSITMQAKYKINCDYLKFHSVLNIKIRWFLLKFIFKLSWKYKCKRSTLYLAVYCMDLFFAKTPTFQNNLEAIAVAQASLHIAMKYQEIYPPSLKEWTSDSTQISRILKFQAEILHTIDFKLNLPSVYYFQQYEKKKFFQTGTLNLSYQNLHLNELKIRLIADLCIFDISLYQFKPSQLAKSIRILVYGIPPKFNEERVVLNIKWALQRNKLHLDWLREHKYKEIKSS